MAPYNFIINGLTCMWRSQDGYKSNYVFSEPYTCIYKEGLVIILFQCYFS